MVGNESKHWLDKYDKRHDRKRIVLGSPRQRHAPMGLLVTPERNCN